jgi:hypothetical protein
MGDVEYDRRTKCYLELLDIAPTSMEKKKTFGKASRWGVLVSD